MLNSRVAISSKACKNKISNQNQNSTTLSGSSSSHTDLNETPSVSPCNSNAPVISSSVSIKDLLQRNVFKPKQNQDVEMESDLNNNIDNNNYKSTVINENTLYELENHDKSLTHENSGDGRSGASEISLLTPANIYSLQNTMKEELKLIESNNSTRTVNLSESNQNIYFMMQAPLDGSSLRISASHFPTLTSLSGTNLVAAAYNSTASALPLGSPPSSPVVSMNGGGGGGGVTKVVRDDRRRANHNEVERRRRDNINKWIVELSKVIPDCSNDQSKHGQSKGGILEKTVLYLSHMKLLNQKLAEQVFSLEKLKQESDLLKLQNEALLKENELLRQRIFPTCDQQQSSSISSSSSPSSSQMTKH